MPSSPSLSERLIISGYKEFQDRDAELTKQRVQCKLGFLLGSFLVKTGLRRSSLKSYTRLYTKYSPWGHQCKAPAIMSAFYIGCSRGAFYFVGE